MAHEVRLCNSTKIKENKSMNENAKFNIHNCKHTCIHPKRPKNVDGRPNGRPSLNGNE